MPVAGLIEEVAEGVTWRLKIILGQLAAPASSLHRLITAGYTFSHLAKPLLALVPNWPFAIGLIRYP